MHVGLVEACIDALDILDCTGVEEKDLDLKIKIFKQLEAYALKGDPQAQVLYTAELLADAHPLTSSNNQNLFFPQAPLKAWPQYHAELFHHPRQDTIHRDDAAKEQSLHFAARAPLHYLQRLPLIGTQSEQQLRGIYTSWQRT